MVETMYVTKLGELLTEWLMKLIFIEFITVLVFVTKYKLQFDQCPVNIF